MKLKNTHHALLKPHGQRKPNRRATSLGRSRGQYEWGKKKRVEGGEMG